MSDFVCYSQLKKLVGRGGVGEFTVKITIAHMLNVTLLCVHSQLRTCWMLRYVHSMQLGPARQLVAQHSDPAEGKVEASFVGMESWRYSMEIDALRKIDQLAARVKKKELWLWHFETSG